MSMIYMGEFPPDIDATSERFMFGSVALVVNVPYAKVLVIATPDYSSADWDTAMAEVKFRVGYVPALGRPEWDTMESVWVWEGDLDSETISDLRF